MSWTSTPSQSLFRCAAAFGALALATATLAAATPAAAFVHMHGGGGFVHGGGGFHPNMAMGGGFNHDFGRHFDHDHDFDHRFHRRFLGFAGFDYEPGYYDNDAYDVCWRRLWGPYGWRWVNVCY
jgi:hypothetical protein